MTVASPLEALGESLRSLVSEVDATLLSAEHVSPLAAPKHRAAAFRLRFDDGRVLKGRVLRDETTAERVEFLLRAMDHPAFPRVVARRKRAMLLEWIEGRPLAPATPAELRSCARLQAELHGSVLADACRFAPRDVLEEQRMRSARHLGQLSEAASLSAPEIESLRALLRAHEPARCEVGILHGDLCAENAIVDERGAIRWIDNEALAVGACDLDLARTLYRWPMTPAECEAYLSAYGETRSLDAFSAHFAFWASLTRLGSAAHRIGAPQSVSAHPVQSLRRLLRSLEEAASPMQAILGSCTSPAGNEAGDEEDGVERGGHHA